LRPTSYRLPGHGYEAGRVAVSIPKPPEHFAHDDGENYFVFVVGRFF
jgi:hypothetical protein